MIERDLALEAERAVQSCPQAYCKFLSANDTGATGGHQRGILVSKSAKDMLFPEGLGSGISKRTVEIWWQNDLRTLSGLTWYSSKNELRITQFGRGFPYLTPDQTGALFVLARQEDDIFRAFILETEEAIEGFLEARGIGPTETNRMLTPGRALPGALEPLAALEESGRFRLSGMREAQESQAIQEFVDALPAGFPSAQEMSAAARSIHNRVWDGAGQVLTDPDRKIIGWTDTEYALFRAIERSRYSDMLSCGFATVDEFIQAANTALNRRKSRAGKSLESHLRAIFDGNGVAYSYQPVTEGRKRPDFLFPSQEAYHDPAFPGERLATLAAKTTCKDRWRQVLNEADRLKGAPKYLCTLQQGVSPAQMDEMQQENVVLVVPAPYIGFYPSDRRSRILSVAGFVRLVRERQERL